MMVTRTGLGLTKTPCLECGQRLYRIELKHGYHVCKDCRSYCQDCRRLLNQGERKEGHRTCKRGCASG
jgi:acetyl-CoA carboxylase beta subunit